MSNTTGWAITGLDAGGNYNGVWGGGAAGFGYTIDANGNVVDSNAHDGGGDTGGKPIILDLDGDGVEMVELEDSTAFFDINGDGYRNHMGWAGADDLSGGAGADVLIGGAGSDTFTAGAGDDYLFVDVDDLQANISAGAGEDTIIVSDGTLGEAGVTLNLGTIGAETGIGNDGDDSFTVEATDNCNGVDSSSNGWSTYPRAGHRIPAPDGSVHTPILSLYHPKVDSISGCFKVM